MQYANVFVQLTCLAKPQAQAVGFEAPFSDLTADFATRRDFAKGIHRSNEVENVSILAYIHEFGHVHSSVIGKRPTLVVVKTVLIEPGMLQYQHGRLFFSKILDATWPLWSSAILKSNLWCTTLGQGNWFGCQWVDTLLWRTFWLSQVFNLVPWELQRALSCHSGSLQAATRPQPGHSSHPALPWFVSSNKIKQSKAKQSKAKQSKAKQSKAKQSKAKQSKAKQSKAKQSKAKQSKAKQSKANSNMNALDIDVVADKKKCSDVAVADAIDASLDKNGLAWLGREKWNILDQCQF
jgi:hypothetical protein